LIFVFEDCELDLDRFELRRAGKPRPVEPQVFDLLAVLIRERRRVVPKEELLDTVWGNRFVTESALTSRVKAARQAIGDDGRGQRLIRTVHGRGYQFVAPVNEAVQSDAVAGVSPIPPAQEIRFCTTADGTRLAYAVRHPERVSHLVLLGSYAQGRRKRARTSDELELAEARIDVVRLGWGRPDPTYRQIFVARFLPEATQEQWRSFDELQRRSAPPENAWRFVDEFANIDVTDLAPKLTVPTLIMCSRREPDNAFEQSRLLAALIPDSRLVPLDSSNHLLPERDPAWKHFLAEVDAFLPGGG
jgi:DNA-binding winged helix-turn-helix (wHTH) protein